MENPPAVRTHVQELRVAATGLDAHVADQTNGTRYAELMAMVDIACEMRMAAVSMGPAAAAAEFYLRNAQRGLNALFEVEHLAMLPAVSMARRAVETALGVLAQ